LAGSQREKKDAWGNRVSDSRVRAGKWKSTAKPCNPATPRPYYKFVELKRGSHGVLWIHAKQVNSEPVRFLT
jgi:hypothetical protein